MFDVMYVNGRFHTQEPSRPLVRNLGVHRGQVISVDDELDASHFVRVIDLHGAAVVPGFNDAHCHLSHVGESSMQLDLGPKQVRSLDSLLSAVREAAEHAPAGDWVIGAGYDQHYLGGEHPTAEQLDAVSMGHPVYLIHVSRHMATANTAAFERAGFVQRRIVEVPEGGAVPVDSEGRAVGVLQETARSLIHDHIPEKSAEEVARLVARGSDELLRRGITSITEPGIGAPEHIGMSRFDLAGFQLARDRGDLCVRATVMPYITTLHPLDAAVVDGYRLQTLDLGLRSGMGDEFLRIGPTKVLTDGSLLGRSAFMKDEYTSPEGAAGFLQFPQQTLREKLIGAHLAGWQLAMHAIGDAALDVVMDIVAEAQRLKPRPDARHRVEHAAMSSNRQIARMSDLGLIPVPQGRFIRDLGDGVCAAVGAGRSPLVYRVRGFLDAGMPIPASTDAPVVDADPIENIAALVDRTTESGAVLTESECLSVSEAIRAYTVNSAHAVHEEKIKGKLIPGQLADFAVLSQDLYEVPTTEIANTQIRATVVGGNVVYGEV